MSVVSERYRRARIGRKIIPLQSNFSKNRREIKFIVPVMELVRINELLSDVLVPDDHTTEHNKGYYNHSIYFDTPELHHYLQKREGMDRRIKVRLRLYRQEPDSKATSFRLELKHRLGGIGHKERLVLSEAQAESILNSAVDLGLDALSSSPVFSTFYQLTRQHTLKPTVAVHYHRAAFHTDIYPGIRITFDTNVRASRLTSLAPPLTSFHYLLDPRYALVELKYFQRLPRLIMQRFNELELEQVTFSKYAAGLESSFRQITDFRQRRDSVPESVFETKGRY